MNLYSLSLNHVTTESRLLDLVTSSSKVSKCGISNLDDDLRISIRADLPPAAIEEKALGGRILPPGINNSEISSD